MLVSIFFLNGESVFSMESIIEKDLAIKYCDSVEKNLFKGLDNERILKYEYFFNSINKEAIKNKEGNLEKFTFEVESICSYKLDNYEKKKFKQMFRKFFYN